MTTASARAALKRPGLAGAREDTYVTSDRDRGWMARGACTQRDPELWFPVSSLSPTTAYNHCLACPVMLRCLDYAWNNGMVHGIWGGTNALERYQYKRNGIYPRRWINAGIVLPLGDTSNG